MSEASIASNVHQTFYIELYFLAKISFDPGLILNDLANRIPLLLREFTNLDFSVNIGLLKNPEGPSSADPIDVGQANVDLFMIWNVDSRDACHNDSPK